MQFEHIVSCRKQGVYLCFFWFLKELFPDRGFAKLCLKEAKNAITHFKTKKNKRGHYCKGCGSNRPNEKFTAKGRKQHLCKDCRNSRSEEIEVWEYEIDCGEWDYLGFNPYEERVSITLADELANQLQDITGEKALEAAVHTSIVITLFLSKRISIEKGANLLNCEYVDFIELLEKNKLPWDIGDSTGNIEYKNSLFDLLQFVDQLDEERD